jgi:hypothetical protein
LKPSPTVTSASAMIVGPLAMPCAARTAAIVTKSVALVTP